MCLCRSKNRSTNTCMASCRRVTKSSLKKFEFFYSNLPYCSYNYSHSQIRTSWSFVARHCQRVDSRRHVGTRPPRMGDIRPGAYSVLNHPPSRVFKNSLKLFKN
jgi:hypothetical protein